MVTIRLLLFVFLLTVCFVTGRICSAQSKADGDLLNRTWTNEAGKKIDGTVTAYSGENVSLKTARGTYRLKIDQLSKNDQNFLNRYAPPDIIHLPNNSVSKNRLLLRLESRKGSRGQGVLTR